MDGEALIKALVAVNAATLVSIVGFGYRVVKFFNSIEFKTDLMWTDYTARVNAMREGSHYVHKRATDHD